MISFYEGDYHGAAPSTLSVVNADGSDERVLAEVRGFDSEVREAWAPDSRRIAVSLPSASGLHDLFLISAHNGTRQQLTRTPGIDERDSYWSPDGRWIATSSAFSPDAGPRDLFLISARDGTRHRLTNTPRNDEWALKWLPDGRRIMFQREKGEVWVISAPGGSGPARVVRLAWCKGCNPTYAAAPGGATLAFTCGSGRRICTIDVGGRHRRSIGTLPPPTWQYPAEIEWSPDGHYLAVGLFGEIPGTRYEYREDIVVYPASGGARWRITKSGEGSTPTWEPMERY